LKELKVKKMTLLTKTPKNVVGLDGFGIKILNQEII
jgi:3,4-dihydroxy 2-butanone 4-phosphate synthase/GTP cyclohydrolase II